MSPKAGKAPDVYESAALQERARADHQRVLRIIHAEAVSRGPPAGTTTTSISSSILVTSAIWSKPRASTTCEKLLIVCATESDNWRTIRSAIVRNYVARSPCSPSAARRISRQAGLRRFSKRTGSAS